MNATERLVEALNRAHGSVELEYRKRLMDDGVKAAAWLRETLDMMQDALAAAKEEQAKVLTDEEIERTGEEEWDRQLANGSSGEQSHAYALGWKKALRYARDNGYLSPAKGSGLTVDEVMEALDNVGRHEGWGLVTVAKGALSKALEAHIAENRGGNLHKGPWISVDDRLPAEGPRVLAWGKGWHRVGECYIEVDDDGAATWMWCDDDEPVREGNVTHWMPLPSPPDTDKTKEG